MKPLANSSNNIPQGKYLLMSFVAGILAIGFWLLYLVGLASIGELPLFPVFLIPALLLISAVIYGAKKSQNHSLIFATWLLGSSFLGIISAYLIAPSIAPNTDPDSEIGFVVFVFFYLMALLGTYQSALDTKKPMTTTWVFILVFGFFSGIAIMGAMFVPFFYIGLMFALVRWLVRWYLTDMPRMGLKIRFVSTILVILAIEISIFYQTFQLKKESETVAQQVLTYYQQHGTYPLTDEIGKHFYTGVTYLYEPKNQQITPYLSYRSIFTPFCAYNFDFKTQNWSDYCTD